MEGFIFNKLCFKMSALNITHVYRKSVLTEVCLYALAKWGIIDLVMVCCLFNTKDLFECWLVIVKMVKMQFRGSGLYKELEGINWCDIFWNSSLNWHFLMFALLCFDVKFSSGKMTSLSWKIIRNTMFWCLTSQSWYHKAGAWEVLLITLCQAWQHYHFLVNSHLLCCLTVEAMAVVMWSLSA